MSRVRIVPHGQSQDAPVDVERQLPPANADVLADMVSRIDDPLHQQIELPERDLIFDAGLESVICRSLHGAVIGFICTHNITLLGQMKLHAAVHDYALYPCHSMRAFFSSMILIFQILGKFNQKFLTEKNIFDYQE